MQITENSAEGLKHEFTVVVEAADIERRVQTRLNEIGRTVRLPGFRPGKVPMGVLRKRYGPSVLGEVIDNAVNDTSSEAIRQHNLRPAMQPRVEILSFNEGTDLSYKMAVEVLPEIKPMNFAALKLERLTPEVPDQEIDEALQRIARQQRKSEPVDRPAEMGDAIVIDFAGSIGGEAFPGGSATDYPLELGSGSFIPGFEEQLVGAKTGDDRTVEITFPEDYGSEDLAGKAASFAVKIKDIRALMPQPIDESLAEAVGMENLESLRTAVRERIQRDYVGIARQKLKRDLLDKLAAEHDFPVPQGMLDIEFQSIWEQLEAERKRATEAAQAEGKELEPSTEDDDKLKAEYRAIAERRVRLGLLLAEVGRANSITVSQDEINRAMSEQARRFPGQERQVVDYYRKNPSAMDSLRAPLYEDKVIDFVLELADVTERAVPATELMAAAEEEDEELAPAHTPEPEDKDKAPA